MNAPIASLVAKGFREGVEKHARKGEKEAEDIVTGILHNLLLKLCTRYDNETGEYPEHEHEYLLSLRD